MSATARLTLTQVDLEAARQWLGQRATGDLEYAVVRLPVSLGEVNAEEAGEQATLSRAVGHLLVAGFPEVNSWHVTTPREVSKPWASPVDVVATELVEADRAPGEAVAILSAAEQGQLPWVLVVVPGRGVAARTQGGRLDQGPPELLLLLPALAGWALLAGPRLQSRLHAAGAMVWPGRATVPSPAELRAFEASRRRRSPLRTRPAAAAAVAAVVAAAVLGLPRLHPPPSTSAAGPASAVDAPRGGLLLPDPVRGQNPGGRSGASLAYDAVTGRVVLVGGGRIAATRQQDLFPDDTWAWDARGWSLLPAGSGPDGHADLAFAFDASGAGVLFGGGAQDAEGTWSFDGLAWHRLRPRTAPDPAVFASAVYDERLRSVLLVTVCCQNSPAGDDYRLGTWAWRGDTWQRLPVRDPPSLTRRPIVAYDREHAVVVMLTQGPGPVDESGDQLTSTSRLWQCDGSSWRQMATPVSPAFDPLRDRFGHDPAGRQMVLFQGGDLPTWTWDGTAWKAWPGAGGPAYTGGIATDQTSGHLLLFGGPDPSRDFDEVWVWADGHWTDAA